MKAHPIFITVSCYICVKAHSSFTEYIYIFCKGPPCACHWIHSYLCKGPSLFSLNPLTFNKGPPICITEICYICLKAHSSFNEYFFYISAKAHPVFFIECTHICVKAHPNFYWIRSHFIKANPFLLLKPVTFQ